MIHLLTIPAPAKGETIPPHCDGCGVVLAIGARVASGIRSCCGGCDRAICLECARRAVALLAPEATQ